MAVSLGLPDGEEAFQAVRARREVLSVSLARQERMMAALPGVSHPAAATVPIGELSGRVVDVSGLCYRGGSDPLHGCGGPCAGPDFGWS